MRLSIVIPVYNERATLRELLKRVASVDLDKELVLVDDGSRDGSRELLSELQRDGLPSFLGGAQVRGPTTVRVIFQPENRGKGAALREGFRAASGDVVTVQDADLEYDPQDLPALLRPLEAGEADVVFGSRFLGLPPAARRTFHALVNGGLTRLSNAFTGLSLTDMETCYKVFRSDVIKAIEVEESRFGVEPELTAKVALLGARVVEVPVRYRGRSREEGKKIGWRDGVRAVWCIVKYGVRRPATGARLAGR